MAVRLAQPSCVREIQQGFPAVLARSTSPLGACPPPMSTLDHKATGISWPWASWLRHLANQLPLCRMIDWSLPLTCIGMATHAQMGSGPNCPCPSLAWAFGDAFPPACGSSASQFAICGDKALATLATSRKPILRCAAYTPCCSGDVLITCSGDVPATFKCFVGTVTGTIRFQQN